jgi:hydroxyacylglutathione hydrolase
MEKLFNSLQILKNLPDDTKIYCAHEYTRQNLKFATIIEPENKIISSYANHLDKQQQLCSLPSSMELEKKINPFLRTDCQPVREYAKKAGINSDNELAVFRFLREEKDKF